MSLTRTLTRPFFQDAGSTTLVPHIWPVAVNGRTFMVDTAHEQWGFRSVELLRQQADTSPSPAEASLNPEDPWRRAVESWHHGAGQTYRDRESDDFRFRTSKGVDPWTRWNLTMLPATASVRSSVNTNLQLAAAGSYLFASDGSTLRVTQDVTVGATFTSTITYTGGAIRALTSDGYYVYLTDGADVYRFARDATTTGAAWNTVNVDVLVYVKGKGRLMGALNTGATRSVYNITGAGAPTDIAPTIIGPDFTWVGFSESASVIYGAGYQGDKSLVFRWGIKSDGTGLDAAVPALPDGLPDGEIVRSIGSYLGYVQLGTDRGLRFCDTDSAGNLQVGALIETDNPVRCFEGQDRYVWYGLENYDTTSTGLGRLDLGADEFIAPLTPPYASDLMVTGQGQVTSVVTFQDRRVFAVSGLGVYAEQTAKVASASVDLGMWTFGLPDDKVALAIDLRHDALAGSVEAALSTDGGSFLTMGENTTAGSTSTAIPLRVTGERFETRLTLARSATATTTGPTVTRLTLEANPAPGKGEELFFPFVFRERLNPTGTHDEAFDIEDAYDFLLDIETSGLPCTLQYGGRSETVFLVDHTFNLDGFTADGEFVRGTYVAKFRRPRRRV